MGEMLAIISDLNVLKDLSLIMVDYWKYLMNTVSHG